MFSDSIHDAYQATFGRAPPILKAVVDYNDYCFSQREATIQSLSTLNSIHWYFMQIDGDLSDKVYAQDWARAVAEFDYERALQGIEYCSDDVVWKNHNLFDANGMLKK